MLRSRGVTQAVELCVISHPGSLCIGSVVNPAHATSIIYKLILKPKNEYV
jgi:hypothetical protein